MGVMNRNPLLFLKKVGVCPSERKWEKEKWPLNHAAGRTSSGSASALLQEASELFGENKLVLWGRREGWNTISSSQNYSLDYFYFCL